MCFYKCCCVGCNACCPHRNLWPGGLTALAVRGDILKNDAAMETEVTLRCSKLVHSRCFLTHYPYFTEITELPS